MKRMHWLCVPLCALSVMLSACATPSGHPVAIAEDSRIGVERALDTRLVLKETYIAGVGGSEDLLPYGEYAPEGEDEGGIYYKAPIPLKKRGLLGGLLSFKRSSLVDGGIYVPRYTKKNPHDPWLYFRESDGCMRAYPIPGSFSHSYGKWWSIETRKNQP